MAFASEILHFAEQANSQLEQLYVIVGKVTLVQISIKRDEILADVFFYERNLSSVQKLSFVAFNWEHGFLLDLYLILFHTDIIF
jgi:hypothetical protein